MVQLMFNFWVGEELSKTEFLKFQCASESPGDLTQAVISGGGGRDKVRASLTAFRCCLHVRSKDIVGRKVLSVPQLILCGSKKNI